jgi:hypothetical protein
MVPILAEVSEDGLRGGRPATGVNTCGRRRTGRTAQTAIEAGANL